jgi:hypothetical protein
VIPDSPKVNVQADAERRRFKRLALVFHIEVSGRDETGSEFRDQAVTTDIREHGCGFNLARQLHSGSAVTVRLTNEVNSSLRGESEQLFQVAWVAPCKYGWSIGATNLQAQPLWPVTFPQPKLDSLTRKH